MAKLWLKQCQASALGNRCQKLMMVFRFLVGFFGSVSVRTNENRVDTTVKTSRGVPVVFTSRAPGSLSARDPPRKVHRSLKKPLSVKHSFTVTVTKFAVTSVMKIWSIRGLRQQETQLLARVLLSRFSDETSPAGSGTAEAPRRGRPFSFVSKFFEVSRTFRFVSSRFKSPLVFGFGSFTAAVSGAGADGTTVALAVAGIVVSSAAGRTFRSFPVSATGTVWLSHSRTVCAHVVVESLHVAVSGGLEAAPFSRLNRLLPASCSDTTSLKRFSGNSRWLTPLFSAADEVFLNGFPMNSALRPSSVSGNSRKNTVPSSRLANAAPSIGAMLTCGASQACEASSGWKSLRSSALEPDSPLSLSRLFLLLDRPSSSSARVSQSAGSSSLLPCVLKPVSWTKIEQEGVRKIELNGEIPVDVRPQRCYRSAHNINGWWSSAWQPTVSLFCRLYAVTIPRCHREDDERFPRRLRLGIQIENIVTVAWTLPRIHEHTSTLRHSA